MVIVVDLCCIIFEDDNVFYIEDIMDFWCFVYFEYVCVEGKYLME